MHTGHNREEIEIDLGRLLRYLWKKAWIVVVATLFWGFIWVQVGNSLISLRYLSATRVMISGVDTPAIESAVSEEDRLLRKYYLEMLISGPVVVEAIETTGLDLTYADVMAHFSAEEQPNTGIITISVQHPNAESAKLLVEALRDTAAEHLWVTAGPGEMTIVEEGYISTSPVNQGGKAWAPYGMMGGCICTIAILLLLYVLDTTIRFPDDIRRCLKLDVWCVISDRKGKKSRKASPKGRNSRNREAYRLLRTNLAYSAKAQTVSVTACSGSDDKSHIIFELARSIAHSGRKVLLIDSDLRNSAFNQMLNGEEEPCDLASYLAGRCPLKSIIFETDTPYFHFIPGGSAPNDSCELLDSRRLQSLLHTVRDSYDTILVDTSALEYGIDAAVVARHCDGTLLLITAGKTRRDAARGAKQQLEQIGCRILGCVLHEPLVEKRKK